jgi:hypothetical protein
VGETIRDALGGGETPRLEDYDLVAFNDLFDPEGGALNYKDFGAIFSSYGPIAEKGDI